MPTVIIYWSRGRSAEQKANVVRKITDILVEEANAAREDVLIIFQNIDAGDAGRNGHILAPPTLSEPLPEPDERFAERKVDHDG